MGNAVFSYMPSDKGGVQRNVDDEIRGKVKYHALLPMALREQPACKLQPFTSKAAAKHNDDINDLRHLIFTICEIASC